MLRFFKTVVVEDGIRLDFRLHVSEERKRICIGRDKCFYEFRIRHVVRAFKTSVERRSNESPLGYKQVTARCVFAILFIIRSLF